MSVLSIFKKLVSSQSLPSLPTRHKSLRASINEENDAGGYPGERLVGGETIIMQYRDLAGIVSSRRITVYRVDDTHIRSWCHEQSAYRTFRKDQVVSLADLDGEEFDNLEEMLPIILDTSFKQIDRQCREMAEPHLEEFYLKRHIVMPEIILLRALARVDGRAHRYENRAIMDYLASRLTDLKIELSHKESEIADRWIRRVYPEEFEIEAAVPQLNDLGKEGIKRFLKACKNIITADGKIMMSEVELYEKLGHAVIAEYRESRN